MAHIGGVITCGEIDWDRAEEHGSFLIFSHGEGRDEFHLRCVVWRDGQTKDILGHNFDYIRAISRDWWTAHESDTPEGCLIAVHPHWRDQAAVQVEAFQNSAYSALISGTLPLTKIREEKTFEHCPWVDVLASLHR
ncbi:hypothetical protein [Sphingomonas xinjiangensis]|uniref:Uncharacterized protein n=1 Tax=Sphingomonas xinjiangensis TaxID=643568 RepID=A0A840YPS6_9SPHN|nr:hypothetical protein [Sphingomonas xinjiangensis]MBB5709683.1 hypothetical protein [Sphingomonas xinjiangensis]